MYVENTGAGDGDISITVAGDEYTAEANYDLDGNGIDETVAVMTDDGFVAYTDADADGEADVMRTIDEHGNVVSQASYDEATGDWVSAQPDRHPADSPDDDAGGKSMVVDTPQGDREIGPPTEDTDNDGKPDTAIVATESGQMMVTDVDGDGSADQVVEISDTGEVTVSHHTGGGEWTVVEKGRINGQGEYTPNPASPASRATDDAAWDFDDNGGTPADQHGPQEGTGFASARPARPDLARGQDTDSVWG